MDAMYVVRILVFDDEEVDAQLVRELVRAHRRALLKDLSALSPRSA